MSKASLSLPAPQEVKVQVRDGIDIALALYMPGGDGPFPTVFAASPYRYDNNNLPATPQFLWRETGPIGLYLEVDGYPETTVPGLPRCLRWT